MSQLAAQSIRRLCTEYGLNEHAAVVDGVRKPMIHPFVDQKVVHNGKSYGLSACSYDVRIGHDLVLQPGESALANTSRLPSSRWSLRSVRFSMNERATPV